MPIREEPWPHGTPSLLSLASASPRAAAEPYANLLGWTLIPDDGAVVATVLDRPVAVFVPGEPDGWATHLVVDDIYVATSTARVAGAEMGDPRPVTSSGRMSRGIDPCGAGIGFWQPTDPSSAVGEVGTLLWSELLVRDLDAARTFYDIAMDVSVHDTAGATDGPSAGQPYATLHTKDGELVARIGVIGDEFDPSIPSHWMPYLEVEDLEDAFAYSALLGFQPLLDPTESDFGRIAIVRGRGGEALGLMELAGA